MVQIQILNFNEARRYSAGFLQNWLVLLFLDIFGKLKDVRMWLYQDHRGEYWQVKQSAQLRLGPHSMRVPPITKFQARPLSFVNKLGKPQCSVYPAKVAPHIGPFWETFMSMFGESRIQTQARTSNPQLQLRTDLKLGTFDSTDNCMIKFGCCCRHVWSGPVANPQEGQLGCRLELRRILHPEVGVFETFSGRQPSCPVLGLAKAAPCLFLCAHLHGLWASLWLCLVQGRSCNAGLHAGLLLETLSRALSCMRLFLRADLCFAWRSQRVVALAPASAGFSRGGCSRICIQVVRKVLRRPFFIFFCVNGP